MDIINTKKIRLSFSPLIEEIDKNNAKKKKAIIW
jgi:hypothetical protein